MFCPRESAHPHVGWQWKRRKVFQPALMVSDLNLELFVFATPPLPPWLIVNFETQLYVPCVWFTFQMQGQQGRLSKSLVSTREGGDTVGGKSGMQLRPSINALAAGQCCYWESPQQATTAHLALWLRSNPGNTQGPACLLWFTLDSSNTTTLHPVFLTRCSCMWRWGLEKT